MQNPKFQAKTLKEEKQRRHRICQDKFGEDWQWEHEPDFYKKYSSLATLRVKKPFKLDQCSQFDPTEVKKDVLSRYYRGPINETQCDKVDGLWDPQSTNRDNLVDRGVCWVRPDDKYCAATHDKTDIIAFKRRGKKGYVLPSMLHVAAKGCNQDDRCEWDAKSYQCVSLAAMEDLDKLRVPKLPSDWPIDITTTNIQEYMRRYYARLLDDTPQAYMSVFGKGNRCVGQQAVKISQPQTGINMIFKGMAERQSPNRGLLIWHSTGSGKCFAKDTPILMYDGTTRAIQDIAPGDMVMGDDSGPRLVKNLGYGRDMMFRVSGAYPGYEYVVNSEHILCLKWYPKNISQKAWTWPGKLCDDNIVHIEVRDYMILPKSVKEELYGYVVPVEFKEQELTDQDTPIDYMTIGETFTQGIPHSYLTGCSKSRLQILSGIIGTRSIEDPNTDAAIDVNTTGYTEQMRQDVLYLARSLGMIAHVVPDDVDIIRVWPERGNREMAITVSYEGTGDYYGFELRGGPNRRFLLGDFTVTHNTCTAAGIMESFWDTDKEIIFASSVQALASNPPEAFMKCAENLFPRFKLLINPDAANDKENRPVDKGPSAAGPKAPSQKRISIEDAVRGAQQKQTGGMAGNLEVHPKIREAFEARGVKFFTFAQLAHYLLIDKPLKVKPSEERKHRELLKNAILIIDEVHNIFKPLPHQKSEHFALRDFLMNYKNPLTSNLNIAILTATPGDTPEEIVDLLNMVRDRRAAPIKVPNPDLVEDFGNFAKSINGLVSYFNIGSDMSKYPYVNKVAPHIAPMSMTQYRKYVEAFDEIKADDKNFEKLAAADKTDAYYKPARRYSNTLFNWDEGIQLNEFSSKIPALLEQIKAYPREKHYIYSAFFENRGYGGHGILAIAKILEKELGYEKIDFKMARDINNGKVTLKPGKRRYVLAITNELTEARHTVGENLQELVKLFNQPENKEGEYVHLFLASQKFNEGVDFKAVRNVHILEPFLSYNKELQTIGRGARYCSHRDLDITTGEWVVNVHKYLADFPIELKAVDIPGLTKHVDDLKKAIADEDGKILAIKGKRGKEFTEIREAAKAEGSKLRAELQQLSKELKDAVAIDPSKYFMIDQRIEEEVRQRTQAQMYLLLVMKMMAVDCKLYKDFHAQSGDKYSCGADN